MVSIYEPGEMAWFRILTSYPSSIPSAGHTIADCNCLASFQQVLARVTRLHLLMRTINHDYYSYIGELNLKIEVALE